jgi:hypothetical protein
MKRCPTCRKSLKTDLHEGVCGGEFEIDIPHPDADICVNCGGRRIGHINAMIYQNAGAGPCLDFEPEYLEVSA